MGDDVCYSSCFVLDTPVMNAIPVNIEAMHYCGRGCTHCTRPLVVTV